MIKKIRHAVGAIIVQKNEYLLVRKVKQMEGPDGPTSIDPVWDFPKGSVRATIVEKCDLRPKLTN